MFYQMIWLKKYILFQILDCHSYSTTDPLSYLSSIQRGYQPWDYVTYVHQTIIQRHITMTIFLYGQIHQGN